MTLFNFSQQEILPSKHQKMMSSWTNAAQDLDTHLNSVSSVSTSTSNHLTPDQSPSFWHRNGGHWNQQLSESTLALFKPLDGLSAGFSPVRT